MKQLRHLWNLEIKLVLSERSTMAYLIACVTVCTLITVLMEHAIVGAEKGWVADIQRNLWIRNWMLLPLGYCWIGIGRFVTSRKQGLIQDAVIAGYKRSDILLSKIFSLFSITAVSLCLIVLPTLPYLDSSTEIWTTLGGLGLTLLSDFIITGWIALFSLQNASSNRILLNLMLLIGLDFIARLVLWIGPSLFDNPTFTWLGEYLPMVLPSSAMNCWVLWEDAWSASTLCIALIYATLLWGSVYQRWQRLIY